MQAPAVVRRLQATRLWRAWRRYGEARANVLAGGISYFAFFSVLPAIALGFTVLGAVLGNRPDLQASLVDQVNSTLGTTVIASAPGGPGLVDMDQLTQPATLDVAGVIGLVGLLIAGLGWLDATREGIRAVFGQPAGGGNPVVTTMRNIAGLATLGAAVLICTAVQIGLGAAAGPVLGWLGLQEGLASGVIRWGGVAILVIIDAGIFLAFFRLLAGVRVPWRDLIAAALLGAVGLGVLTVFGGVLLRRMTGGSLLASVSVIVLALLIWMNLVARLTLLAAALAATTATDRGHLPAATADGAQAESSGGPATSAPASPMTPSFGRPAAGRAAVAAGAVLGATGVLAARAITGAGRGMLTLVLGPRERR